MDIQSAEQSFQNVRFKDDAYQKLLDHFKHNLANEDYHLSILIGPADKPKEKALKQIAEKSGREIHTVDANQIISKIESETYKSLDRTFKRFSPADSLLYLKNGSRLCGVYTGYTYSKVKYASPQERYFLKKIQEKGGLYIIDIADGDDADTTIRRAAQSIVNFPPPKSGLKRFLWKLRRQFTVHGHELKNKRPEHYRNQTDNF